VVVSLHFHCVSASTFSGDGHNHLIRCESGNHTVLTSLKHVFYTCVLKVPDEGQNEKLLLKDTGFDAIGSNLGFLLVFSIIAMTLATRLFKRTL
jgi:hypothetical protein